MEEQINGIDYYVTWNDQGVPQKPYSHDFGELGFLIIIDKGEYIELNYIDISSGTINSKKTQRK